MIDNMFVKKFEKVLEVLHRQLGSGSALDILHTSPEIKALN
jgi:hypothetical protein